MSRLTHTARAAALSALIASSFISPAFAAAPAPTATQSVQTAPKSSFKMQAANFADSTGKTTKKAWKFMNTNRPHGKKALDMRRKTMRAVAPVNRAMGGAFTFTDNKMSRPFLFLMLAFIVVLGLLGMSSSKDRTCSYH